VGLSDFVWLLGLFFVTQSLFQNSLIKVQRVPKKEIVDQTIFFSNRLQDRLAQKDIFASLNVNLE